MSITRKIASVLVALGMSVLPLSASTPALAHDGITGTTPGEGETVDAGAFDVTVTASEDIMNMADMAGNEIWVSGPKDSAEPQQVSLTCIKVSGATAAVPVDIDVPGVYTATWRLVSADGHPQEGSFDFTVKNDSGYTRSGNTDLPEGCQPLVMLTAMPMTTGETPVAIEDVAADTGDGQYVGLLWGIGFVVVGSLAGVGVVWLRERRKSDEALMKKLAESDPEL
ncbi:MAG: hypothetical protein RL645_502 [Actinomycetota bacterium]|jgi:methionine-rich copper-binding protein CopC